MDKTYSRLPIDIDAISEITSDEVIVLGEPTWPEQWRKNITSYRQYQAGHPDIEEQLARREIFRATDPTMDLALRSRCLNHCDVIKACDSLNFRIMSNLWGALEFPESLACRRSFFRLSLEETDPLFPAEAKEARGVPERMKELIQAFADIRPGEEGVNAAAVIAGIEIMKLPEFQGPEGIMRLTRLLYVTSAPSAGKEEARLDGGNHLDIDVYTLNEREIRPGNNRDLLNRLPYFAHRDLEHAIYGWVQEMRDTFSEEQERANVYVDSSPDKPSFMSRLTNAQARDLLVPVINAMNGLPAKHGKEPQASDISKEALKRSLNFIAGGLDTVVVVAARDTTYFHPKQRRTVGLSFETLGEYVAIGSSREEAVSTLCEEAAHSAIRKLYGNHASPFLFAKGGDARDVFLQDVIKAELKDTYQLMEFCGGELGTYDEDEYAAEAVAKVMRQMAQGKWTDEDRQWFPRLTLFVEKVVLRDAEMLEQGMPRIQNKDEIAQVMLEASKLKSKGGLPRGFNGLNETMTIEGINAMLQAKLDDAMKLWHITPSADGDEYRGGLPQTPNAKLGVKPVLPQTGAEGGMKSGRTV